MMKQPTPPTITLDSMTAYLESKNPHDTYIWADPVHCLMGNFLRDHGHSWGEVVYSEFMPHYDEIAAPAPHTFGAALERARAIKALPQPAPTLELTASKSELLPVTENAPQHQ